MNPSLGEDIDLETLDRVTRTLQGTYLPSTSNENAQLRELAFWRWVAYEGYAGKPPGAFPEHQRVFMTQCFAKTGWSLDQFQASSAFELGCGPLGMIEYVPARLRYAYDPLNEYYSRLFKNVRSKDISYLRHEEQILDMPQVDLGICFNVLDHTPDAKKYLDLLFAKINPGGRFIVQVNTIRNELARTREHESMHPSPVTFDQINFWLKLYSADYRFELSNQPTPDNEFFFMGWGSKSVS